MSFNEKCQLIHQLYRRKNFKFIDFNHTLEILNNNSITLPGKKFKPGKAFIN